MFQSILRPDSFLGGGVDSNLSLSLLHLFRLRRLFYTLPITAVVLPCWLRKNPRFHLLLLLLRNFYTSGLKSSFKYQQAKKGGSNGAWGKIEMFLLTIWQKQVCWAIDGKRKLMRIYPSRLLWWFADLSKYQHSFISSNAKSFSSEKPIQQFEKC